MKKIADFSKLTHHFADTCCYTNLKSKILSKARCGIDLSPLARRKRTRKRCPVERNDVRHCPKCKKINDTIWTAHNNTGLWVNDDALEWFETQKDSRRHKHMIYEEYMSRPDAPMIMYSSEGIKFIPPPTVPKEKKNRLDAKNFKRISPEFLRLLQRHHDIVLKNERHEHEPDIETETPVRTLTRKKTPAKPRASYYLKGLKKINFKTTERVASIISNPSKSSFNKKTYFKKKRQPNQVRSKAGKEENSSSATHLQTLCTYYPKSSPNKSLQSASGHISLNRQRGGKEVNCNMSNITSLAASYRLNPTSKAPLRARRNLIKIIKPKAIQKKPLNLNKAGYSKVLATTSLCNGVPSLPPSSSLRLGNGSLPSTSNAISRTHKRRYRQKEIVNLKKPLSQIYDRNRGKHFESVSKSSIPLTGSYLLATVGDPFETHTMTSSYCQFTDGHLESFNSEGTLKAIDSNIPMPESSDYLLSTIADPFEAKTPKHSFCHLGTNTRSIKSLTPVYSYTSFAPSTSSVQTQTHCSKEQDNVAKSTQALLTEQQSFSNLEMLSPTSSTLGIDGTSSKDSIIVKPNPSATRRPNHHYPRI